MIKGKIAVVLIQYYLQYGMVLRAGSRPFHGAPFKGDYYILPKAKFIQNIAISSTWGDCNEDGGFCVLETLGWKFDEAFEVTNGLLLITSLSL